MLTKKITDFAGSRREPDTHQGHPGPYTMDGLKVAFLVLVTQAGVWAKVNMSP